LLKKIAPRKTTGNNYNIALKALLLLVCTKISELWWKTARGKAECCISLSTCPLMLYYPYMHVTMLLKKLINFDC